MSAYESRETIPEDTLASLVGPGKRYEVPWYSLKPLAESTPPQGRSPVWESIYGTLVREAKRCRE